MYNPGMPPENEAIFINETWYLRLRNDTRRTKAGPMILVYQYNACFSGRAYVFKAHSILI